MTMKGNQVHNLQQVSTGKVHLQGASLQKVSSAADTITDLVW